MIFIFVSYGVDTELDFIPVTTTLVYTKFVRYYRIKLIVRHSFIISKIKLNEKQMYTDLCYESFTLTLK